MATPYDRPASRPLAGVRREAHGPALDSADHQLARQRCILSNCLGSVAVICFILGFYASALWVLTAFFTFAALIASKASPGYRISSASSYSPIETGASTELMPGTPYWHIRLTRDHGE